MTTVNVHGFGSQQMDGNCVAGKSIQHQYIELLIGLSIEHKSRIAGHHAHTAFAVGQERKVLIGEADHRRIDFIKSKTVTRSAVSGQGSRTKSDHTDVARRCGCLAKKSTNSR